MKILSILIYSLLITSCGTDSEDEITEAMEDDIKSESNADFFIARSDGLKEINIRLVGTTAQNKVFFVTETQLGLVNNLESKDIDLVSLPESAYVLYSAREVNGSIYLVVPKGVIRVDTEALTSELFIDADETLEEVSGGLQQTKYGKEWNDFYYDGDEMVLLATTGYYSGTDELNLTRSYGSNFGSSRSISQPVFLADNTTIFCDALKIDLSEDSVYDSSQTINQDELGFLIKTADEFSYQASGFSGIEPSDKCLTDQIDETSFVYVTDSGFATYQNGEISKADVEHGDIIKFSSNGTTYYTVEKFDDELYYTGFKYDGVTYEEIYLSGDLTEASPNDVLILDDYSYIASTQGVFVFKN